MQTQQISGPAKAAILLLSLDQEETVHILEHLGEDDVRRLRDAVNQLKPIPAEALEQVYREFTDAFNKGVTTLPDGDHYLKELVRRAQGEESAERFFGPPEPEVDQPEAEETSTFSDLTNADPAVLRFTIAEEHPQVAAAVLAHLEPAVAAEILESLEPARQADLLLRISTLEPIQSVAFTEAATCLRGVKPDWQPDVEGVEGISMAAGILGEMPTADANGLIERLAEAHPEEATQLRRAMFTMENLIDADTRGLQQLLKEVQTDTLLVALKTASEGLRKKFFGCMSKRAAVMLEEEAGMLPPMRLADVEAAQQQIVETATWLMSEGKLHVKGHGEELV